MTTVLTDYSQINAVGEDIKALKAEIERLRKALDTEKRWNATLEITARKDAQHARNDALEDAATVAEYHSYTYDIAGQACSRNIAAAIRAIKREGQ